MGFKIERQHRSFVYEIFSLLILALLPNEKGSLAPEVGHSPQISGIPLEEPLMRVKPTAPIRAT